LSVSKHFDDILTNRRRYSTKSLDSPADLVLTRLRSGPAASLGVLSMTSSSPVCSEFEEVEKSENLPDDVLPILRTFCLAALTRKASD
jgi:hypothetical protein